MSAKWHFKDLIDLEYYLRQDDEKNGSKGSSSVSLDRQIYLDFAKSHPLPPSSRDLLKFWLERQKEKNQSFGSENSPGEAFSESIRIVRAVIIFIALFFGASVAWTILTYHGISPINIFTFLWVIIVPQLILLSILIFSLILRRLGLLKSFTGFYPLISALIRKLALKLKRAGESQLSAAKRDRIQSIFGLIGHQKTLYGSIFFWPIFLLFQTFGTCFNIGVLSASVIKITITDLAFGWESTLQLSAHTLYRVIEYISAPWSWFVSIPYSHPSLEQIEGTKMILKEGMTRLSTTDLVSWWPFLCLTVLFYGLLPRLLLLTGGAWRQHSLLKKIDFTHAACDRLIQQMQTPQMKTVSRPFLRKSGPSNKVFISEEPEVEPIIDSGESMPSTIIFVPEDIDHKFSEDELQDRILSVFRLRILGRIALTMDFSKDRDTLKNLLDHTDVSLSSVRIIVIQEAWQPPIKEIMSWINNLRNAAGKKTGIIIALTGKPVHDKIFTSPKELDLLVWEHAVDSLGDPYIRVEKIGG